VRIDDHFFKGYALPDFPGAFYALVALPLEKKTITQMRVEAVDLAGNKAHLPVAFYLRKKRYRKDTIRISDQFLERKMPEFWSRYEEIPRESPLKAFIYVNSELRRRNNEEIRKLCGESRLEKFYGIKPFLALPRAATRARFGDHRTYYYRGQKIGEAVHLGLDLASLAGAPVPAAAEGQVIFADYLGIYGNTIILDHGLGLFTLYAHLSGFTVSEGDHVKRGQLIGYTDTTGLAGGDHLHFGTLVQGIFVDPVEWLDPRWVRTRIVEKLHRK
jgi:murein DD-endopeptidase MepM/ murein hydrolase activator NlpD